MSWAGLSKEQAIILKKQIPKFYRCYNCGNNKCYLVFPDGKIFTWGDKESFRWHLAKGIIKEKVVFT